MEIKTLEEAKELVEEYSQLEQATPFHSYEWLSALESLGTKCEIAVFKNAICPIFRKKMGPVEIGFSPIFGTETAYLGIVSKDSDINSKLKQLKKEAGNFFMILPPGTQTDFGSSETAQTIITKFNQPSAEEHFKIIKKGHRYCVNKAEKDGVTIEEDYSDEAIETYYKMLMETYSASDYNPLPKEFYKKIIQGLHAKNQIKLLFAKYQGKTIGCAAFPHSGKTIYYWTGASIKGELAKLYPNNVIQWHIIKWAYENGFKKYDMLGAGIEGIRNFKLGWGGEIADYTRVYSSSSLKLAASAYSKIGSGLKSKIRAGIR
jgi:lipid II:glycine glycyltransferase (peptidoglycan interpeptide bridge formation enzyme)|tara:strand:- start:20 stop:973 length:954 start_codon:yes stop_codon:yes gene_type:complete